MIHVDVGGTLHYQELEDSTIERPGEPLLHYTMAILDESYASQVMQLQNIIVEEINDPVFYDPVTPENIQKRFEKEGLTIGVFFDNQLIGFRIIHFPPPEDDNFGKDLGMGKAELPKVAHLAATIVHPSYRRYQFAYKMNLHAVELIKSFGFRHLCSTVFPGNFPNIVTQFRTGLTIRRLKEKYGGKLRYIFYRDLAADRPVFNEKKLIVPITDVDTQVRLLEKGYVGYSIETGGDQIKIVYAGRD